MRFLKHNTVYNRMVYLGSTGLTPTATISKNGGAFAAPAGSFSEVSDGWYLLALAAGDTDTLGDLAYSFSTGAMSTEFADQVIAADLFDGTALGLAALPSATAGASGGLVINGSNNGTLVFNNGVVIADAGLHIQNSSGNAVAISADSGHASVLINGGVPGIEIDGGATGPGVKIQGGTDGIAITAVTGRSINAPIETGCDLVQALRLILSALAGKLSISGNTVTIRDVNDTTDRITATTDSNGQRTAVTTNVS